jgi:hypothetical protein
LPPKKTSSSKILLDGLLGVPSPLMLLAGWLAILINNNLIVADWPVHLHWFMCHFFIVNF